MTNSIILENINRDELSAIVSEAVKKQFETKVPETNFLSRRQFQAITGTSLPTIDAAIKRGEFEVLRIGKRVLIRESELKKSPYLKK